MQAQQFLLQEGMQNYQQGNYEKSIDLLNQTIQRDSLQLNAYVLLGASYLKQEVPEMAQLKVEQGLQHFSDSGPLKWTLAEALFQQRLIAKAQPVYSELYAQTREGKTLQPLQVGRSQIKERMIQTNKILASQAFKANKLDKSQKYITNIQELNPGDFEAQKNIVYLYLKKEEWDKALDAVNKALEDEPGNRDLLRMKASALYNLKDFDGLISEYKKLYEQDPDDIKTALTYGEVLVGSQKSSEAVKVYERLLDKYPNDRRIYEALITINQRRLNISGERAVLRRMEDQFAGDNTISKDIAATFEQESKWGEARAVYDSLLVTGKDSLQLQKNIAKTFVEQDSLVEAEMLYEQLYQQNKSDKELVMRYGKVLGQEKKWEPARILYDQFIDKQKDKVVYYRLGIALTELERHQAAINVFRKALSLGNKNPDLYLRLSKLLAQKGQEKLPEAWSKSKLALNLSLKELKKSQKEVEQQLSKNSLGNQLKNKEQFEKIEQLNKLAERSFKHFTGINSSTGIRKIFDQIESEYPGSGQLLYLIGDYYQGEQQYKRAKSYYQKSIKYSPQFRDAHVGLGDLLEADGQYSDAISSYERALSLDPQKPEPYDALIRLYRKQGQLNALCDRWKAKYRANLKNKILKDFLIEALHKAKRYDEAKKVINGD